MTTEAILGLITLVVGVFGLGVAAFACCHIWQIRKVIKESREFRRQRGIKD